MVFKAHHGRRSSSFGKFCRSLEDEENKVQDFVRMSIQDMLGCILTDTPVAAYALTISLLPSGETCGILS